MLKQLLKWDTRTGKHYIPEKYGLLQGLSAIDTAEQMLVIGMFEPSNAVESGNGSVATFLTEHHN